MVQFKKFLVALAGILLIGTIAVVTPLTGQNKSDKDRVGPTKPATPGSARDFEVWLVDQSDSFGKTYGGTIHIYEGSDLNGNDASSATPTDVLDLGGATAARCLTQTGANPERPHMLFFNAAHSHAILSFVASGHVVVFEAATRTPVACVRTSVGAGGQRQAHAATPTPDDAYILVANQNGKRVDRITTDYATNTFVLDATLDLANGVTPNGVLREFAGRPDNAPILVVPDATSTLAFVTLRGGGLFVVDPTTMEILAEYDRTTVHANGFGGVEANDRMYINSGAGDEHTNPSEFDVYRFPLAGYGASNPPNTPAPVVVYSDDTVPPAHVRDAHGLVATKHKRYIWVFDRALRVAEVFDTRRLRHQHVNTIALAHPLIDVPTPDLADISPDGHRIFVSLRGPNPLSGSPHAATGSTPGLGVIQVTRGGKHGVLESVVRISNIDTAGVERADAHGIRVRLK